MANEFDPLMKQPTNMEEYTSRFMSNSGVTGYGVETAQIFPCFFCAAPNFMTCKIVNIEKDMEKGATCLECGRSAKARFFRNGGQITFEFLQTGGDDPPDWLEPKIKREVK